MSQENESIKTDNRTWADLWPVFWDPAVTWEAISALYLDTLVRMPGSETEKQISDIQGMIAGSEYLVFSREKGSKKGEILFEAKNPIGKPVVEGSLETVVDKVEEIDHGRKEFQIYPVMDKQGFPVRSNKIESKKRTAIPSAAAINEFNESSVTELLVRTLYQQIAKEGRKDMLVDRVGMEGVYEKPTGARTLQMALGRVKPVSRQGTRQAHYAVPRRRSGAD